MAAPHDARRLASDVLVRVEGGAFCDLLVGETLARAGLAERDAALFTRLVYGTVTWQGRLDWTIARLARRPLAQLDPPVRSALRLALYQLVLLDRIPPHAAVNASVEIAKRSAGPAAASFVNAVLRAALRQGGESALPDERDGPARALAVRWSHPEWLVERWLAELGAERVPALLAANNQPSPTVLRVDLRIRTRAAALAELAERGIAARPATHAHAGIALDGPVGDAPSLAWATPQGEASQLVADLLAGAGARVVDLCAAPGGKASAIAEKLPEGAAPRVIALDRSRAGIRRVAELRRKGRDRPLHALRGDATRPPFPPQAFDAALLDAPCSGLGTLRSHPEIRWRRSPDSIAELAATQRRMLAAAARLVRPGGRLVYATCTLVREENDDVVADFLARQPGWRRDDARPLLPSSVHPFVDRDGTLRTAPDRDGLDGFFAVRLARDPG